MVNVKPPANSATLLQCEMTLPLAARTVTVRVIEERDLRLLEWQGGEDLRSFYDDLWRNHQRNEIEVLVADFNQFPIGLAVIHWPGKPTHPGIPDVQSLRVHPVFRGLKVGSHLLRVCEAKVKERGFGCIGLSVNVDNPAARRLYERHGYRLVGEPYCDIWYYTDARGQAIRVEESVVDLLKNI